MSDQIDGKAGDDVLIGGRGIDFLTGGLGADQFILDVDANETDEILDFNPEEGDTIVLWHRADTTSSITINNVKVTLEGELQVSLDGKRWRSIANLHRPNLTFKIQNKGNRATLRFETRF